MKLERGENSRTTGRVKRKSAKRDWLFDVSAQFIRNARLSSDARFLFVLIRSYQGADGTLPFPGHELLEDLMGRGRHAVDRYILELVTAGYLVKKKPRRSNGTFGSVHYALSWQPQAQNPPMVQPQAHLPPSAEPTSVEPPAVNVPTEISHSQHLPPSTSTTVKKEGGAPSESEVQNYCKSIGLRSSDGSYYFFKWEGDGWPRRWQSTLKAYQAAGYAPSQKKRGAITGKPKPLQVSKITVPDEFKQWVGERYPDRAADAKKWETWAQVPDNGLRQEWWREANPQLIVGRIEKRLSVR